MFVFIVLNTYACVSLSTIIQRHGIVPRLNRTWRRVPLVPRTAGKQFHSSCSIHSTFVASAVNHYSRFELLNAAMPERFATITIAANANTSVSDGCCIECALNYHCCQRLWSARCTSGAGRTYVESVWTTARRHQTLANRQSGVDAGAERSHSRLRHGPQVCIERCVSINGHFIVVSLLCLLC